MRDAFIFVEYKSTKAMYDANNKKRKNSLKKECAYPPVWGGRFFISVRRVQRYDEIRTRHAFENFPRLLNIQQLTRKYPDAILGHPRMVDLKLHVARSFLGEMSESIAIRRVSVE